VHTILCCIAQCLVAITCLVMAWTMYLETLHKVGGVILHLINWAVCTYFAINFSIKGCGYIINLIHACSIVSVYEERILVVPYMHPICSFYHHCYDCYIQKALLYHHLPKVYTAWYTCMYTTHSLYSSTFYPFIMLSIVVSHVHSFNAKTILWHWASDDDQNPLVVLNGS